jgi:hypothetical protein
VEKLIEECTGRIMELLRQTGEANVLSLPNRLSSRNILVFQAVGWLLREARITIRQTGAQYYVTPSSDAPDSLLTTERRIP